MQNINRKRKTFGTQIAEKYKTHFVFNTHFVPNTLFS